MKAKLIPWFFLGIFLVYLGLDYHEFLKSEQSDFLKKKKEIDQLTTSLKKNETLLNTLKSEQEKEAQPLPEKVPFEKADVFLSFNGEVPSFLEKILNLARQKKINIRIIKPEKTQDFLSYKDFSFYLEWEGAFINSVHFLQELVSQAPFLGFSNLEMMRNPLGLEGHLNFHLYQALSHEIFDPSDQSRNIASLQSDAHPTQPLVLASLKKDPFQKGEKINPSNHKKSDLELFTSSAFQLMGVLTGPDQTKALLLAPNGKTYFVSEKTKIGNRSGVITRIHPDYILVSEGNDLKTTRIEFAKKGSTP